jgi:hypothetical protein
MPSKPPSAQCSATSRVPGDDLGDLGVDTALGTSRNSGSATGDGAHTGRREYMLLAWPPLWLIWAKIGVRWRCTASVMARYPGITSRWKPWMSFSYGQSVGWVLCSSVMISPAPPAARAA